MNHKINRLNDSGAKAGLNLPTIRSVPLTLPPIPEQRKIAQILSTWDKAISATESLIKNSKQHNTALMQQLLTGKKRFAGFKGEWEEVKLGELCSKVTDGAHHSPNSVDVGYPMYSVKDMSKSNFKVGTARLISNDDYQSLVKQNCKPELNDILIAKDGSILKHCFVVNQNIDGVILSSIAILRPKLKKVCPDFIAQYLGQDFVKLYVAKIFTTGSGVPRIVLKDFKKIKVLVPAVKEQQKIASVLSAADQEIDTLQQKLTHLKQEKKALMQQLLTGKRRVIIDNTEEAVR
jgi:type I restriction enzyme S subunit